MLLRDVKGGREPAGGESAHGGVERYALSVFPEIRPARLVDAVLIARMSRNLIERGLTWRWTPQVVAPHIRDSETAVVVARADDRMLGFAILGFRFLRSEAHMLLLAVDPAARRSGVGRALWRWLETIARRGGIGRVELEVRAENSGGRAFYHALGFREVARLRDYYQSREDALRMVADLRPRRRSTLASKLVRPVSVIVTLEAPGGGAGARRGRSTRVPPADPLG